MLKMNFIFKIFIIFLSISLNAQQRRSADYYAQIPEKIENEQEIRIYKDFSLTNGGKIFRIYFKNNKCNAELISWFFPQTSSDEYNSENPEVTKFQCSDKTFMNFEIRNIQYLPKEDYFNYKREKKTVVLNDETKEYDIEISHTAVMDGVGYNVMYKNGNVFNQFFYSNPKTYSEHYPEIDELQNFMEILKYIESEFKIKF